MSYCRFENTASDLGDCLDHLFDDDLSEYEAAARKRLIRLCQEVAAEWEDEDDFS